MTKTVLSVGQCRPDHAAISHFLTSNFSINLLTADLASDCEKVVAENTIDLILINRKLDADYSDGMVILESLKADEATRDIPVMLVSNLPEWQQKAQEAGALCGFGKAELNSPETVDRVRAVLG